MNTATEWIRTDRNACRKDVARLGLDAATDYHMDLIADRAASGDDRWNDITRDDMRAALEEIDAQKSLTA
jgi:hypothetical protein